ncbi:transcriptional regulator, LuxR family/hydrolase, alpha/beta fold family protein [Roseobacter sp. SK209-2-6]|uniref:alpha/beta hydrolase n=1 Tax=Roseobacter sp. SK209-2-6 TaxID=388739 RepID=UPI0000F3C76D|nr:alpha/beta hydrolase [Roseobacter sp. SK209-2-6]EBA18747.1 transcriptional regulator, LuxR family/hydrolase, alpha/beta fold family protein [Roseobacter sp. SK209-2-6]
MKEQDDFTSLVGSIYATAVDPSGFAELLALADSRLAEDSSRRRFEALLSDFEDHVLRAEALLAALPEAGQQAHDGAEHCPRFRINRQGRIFAPNLLACELLGLVEGQSLDRLELSADTLGAVQRFSRGQSQHAPVLRLMRRDTGKPILLRCEALEDGEGVQCLAVDIPWHAGAEMAMRALYGLTPSENAVLGLLVEGHSPQEAAHLRGRSVETIRQQIKAIFVKTHTSGLQDLLHLGRVVSVSSPQLDRATAVAGQTSELRLPDGRVLSYRQIGDPSGRPVIFLHGCLGGNQLPRAAEVELYRLGLRWIAPARPWHGGSCGWPGLLSHPENYGEDLAALADHLDLNEVTLVGYDAGAILACCAGEKLGSRLHKTFALAITPPMCSLRDFAAAPTQQRILALAARTSLPLLRYLSILGDRKLRLEGQSAFAQTVFRDAPADLEACRDPEVLELMWQGHFFHVGAGNDSFINDCRLIASEWRPRVTEHPAPLVFLHGREDRIVPLPRARSFAEELKANLIVVKGAGHSLPFSHWQAVLAALYP